MATYDPNIPPAPPPKPLSQSSRTASPMVPAAAFPPPPDADLFVPPMLFNKSRDDLQHLLSNPALLDAVFTATHPTSTASNHALTSALQKNLEIATRLTELEASLSSARESTERQLLDTRSTERQWREKEKEMYQSLQPFSSPALYNRLSIAVGEAESVSEALAASFLEEGGGGGRDVGEFVREYRGMRKTFHLRKERKERWDEGRVGGWR